MAKLLAEPTVRMAQPVVVEAFQLQGNTPLAYLRNLTLESIDGSVGHYPDARRLKATLDWR